MPLLQPEDKTQLEELKFKVRADLLAELKLYARAVDSSLEYVVSEALRKLTRDKAFLAWKATHPELCSRSPESPKTGPTPGPVPAKSPKGAAA